MRVAVSCPASTANPALTITCKESRIGKEPVGLPKGVTLTLEGQSLSVKGPLGELSRVYPREIKVTQEGEALRVSRTMDTRRARAFHGLFRCEQRPRARFCCVFCMTDVYTVLLYTPGYVRPAGHAVGLQCAALRLCCHASRKC